MTEVEPELKNESLFSYKSSDISRIDVWREIFSEGNEDFKDRACGLNFICFKNCNSSDHIFGSCHRKWEHGVSVVQGHSPNVSTASRFFTTQFFLASRLAVRERHT